MSQEKFDNERELRRFLLGEMSENERAAFEVRFIAEDGELFDRIGVMEDELLESYVRGTLSEGEKAKFERNFLITGERQERVAFTRAMLEELAAQKESAAQKTETAAGHSPARNFFANLFSTPRTAFAAGFAILLLVFGFWFLFSRKPENRGDDLARQITPTPAPSPSRQNNQNAAIDTNIYTPNRAVSNQLSTANSSAENASQNQSPKTSPKPSVAFVALFAGTVRSEGRTGELNLTKETASANFQLHLESRDYQKYRAEIVDADGRVIYRSGNLTARNFRVNVFFPTAKLQKGDYFVKLYGLNSTGAEESAADFQFRVSR